MVVGQDSLLLHCAYLVVILREFLVAPAQKLSGGLLFIRLS